MTITKPTTAQLIATLRVAIAKINADNAASKLDRAEGEGRR